MSVKVQNVKILSFQLSSIKCTKLCQALRDTGEVTKTVPMVRRSSQAQQSCCARHKELHVTVAEALVKLVTRCRGSLTTPAFLHSLHKTVLKQLHSNSLFPCVMVQ
jgi:hypothetical protein